MTLNSDQSEKPTYSWLTVNSLSIKSENKIESVDLHNSSKRLKIDDVFWKKVELNLIYNLEISQKDFTLIADIKLEKATGEVHKITLTQKYKSNRRRFLYPATLLWLLSGLNG